MDKNEQIKDALKQFVSNLPAPDLDKMPFMLKAALNSMLGDKTPIEFMVESMGEIPDSYVPLVEKLAQDVVAILNAAH